MSTVSAMPAGSPQFKDGSEIQNEVLKCMEGFMGASLPEASAITNIVDRFFECYFFQSKTYAVKTTRKRFSDNNKNIFMQKKTKKFCKIFAKRNFFRIIEIVFFVSKLFTWSFHWTFCNIAEKIKVFMKNFFVYLET